MVQFFKKNSWKAVLIIAAIIAYLAFLVQITGFGKTESIDLNRYVTRVDIDYSDGREETYNDMNLPTLNKGDTVTFHIQMPKVYSYSDYTLCFFQYHSMIRVMCDHKTLYSFGYQLKQKHEMFGMCMVYVNTDMDLGGKEVIIKVAQQEGRNSSHYTYFRLLPRTQVSMYPLRGTQSLYFIIYESILLLSIILLIICIACMFLYNNKRTYITGMSIAAFCFMASIWQLGNQGMLYTVCTNRQFNANAEYFAIDAAGPLLFYFCSKMHREKLQRIAYYIVSLAFTVVYAYALVQHGFFHNHLIEYETLETYMWGVAIIVTVIMELLSMRAGEKDEKLEVFHVGLIISAIIGALYIIVQSLRIAFPTSAMLISLINANLTGLAVLSVVCTLMFILIILLSENVTRQAREIEMRKLAYTDALTDTHNRAYCELILDTIDNDPRQRYAIVFFDVDMLKATNDRYGHEMGDRLIKEASDIIKRATEGMDGIYGRWGGDEFIAVLKNPLEDVMAFRKKFAREVAEVNKNNEFPFEVSISYGMAINNRRQGKTASETMKEADDRMYAYKTANKKERR